MFARWLGLAARVAARLREAHALRIRAECLLLSAAVNLALPIYRNSFMLPRVLGVIPARGGSKRIYRKNLRPLCGKPLIAWTIEAAHKAESLTNWVVSTEDYEIGQVSVALGAYVVRRPEELADDLASSDSVALHVLDWLGSDYDIVCLLHPTSPVRDPRHIDECVSLLWASKAPSIASVEYAKRSYRHNASIYAAKVPFTTLYGDKTIPYLMDKPHSVDIDDETDFKLAEIILNGIIQ